MVNSKIQVSLVGVVLTCASSAWALPTPILDYRFDDRTYTYTGATQPGSGAASLGSDASPVGFRNKGDVYPAGNGQSVLYGDFLSTSNNGVSGAAGDHAFQTDANVMGGTGDSRAQGGSIAALSSLSSVTVTGWFMTRSTVQFSSDARLVRDKGDSGTDGFSVHGTATPGQLELNIDNGTVDSTAAPYTATQSWVFFAASYDGTKTADNVLFYIGSKSNPVSLVGTSLSLNSGALNAVAGKFCIGNANPADDVFDGFLDDVKVFGANSGSSGVLSQADLESVRQADLVPEPTAAGLMFAAGCALGLRRRGSRIARGRLL